MSNYKKVAFSYVVCRRKLDKERRYESANRVNAKEKISRETRRGKRRKKFRKTSVFPSIFILARLGINFAIINCEDIINLRLDRPSRAGVRDNVAWGGEGVALKCARNAREDVKDEGTVRDAGERDEGHGSRR